jgi:secreted trypsin-like serine protease
VSSAHDRWFCYQFDKKPKALPLEAISSNGDSGGPALIEVDGQWAIAGISSWKMLAGDVRTARPGRYEQFSCNVRLSHYRPWIEGEMAADDPAR